MELGDVFWNGENGENFQGRILWDFLDQPKDLICE